MLLGVSPREHIGLPGASLATVAIMRSPSFVPEFVATAAVESIGIGQSVGVYADVLRSVTSEFALWQVEMRIPGAYGKMVAHVIQQTVQKHSHATVSPHVHVCAVRRGSVDITASDHASFWHASGQQTHWRMPTIATTWPAFEALVQVEFGAGASAGGGRS
jgi:hypothetical protein